MPINYNFSEYRISTQGRISSFSFTSHWFLIQVISSIIDISTFGNSKKIYFTSENMVSNGLFCMYLNHDQYAYLKESNYFQLYFIDNNFSKSSILKSSTKGNYFVHASNDWQPPRGSRVISRPSDTIFQVENLQIDQNLVGDPKFLYATRYGKKILYNRYNSGFLQNGCQVSHFANDVFQPLRPIHSRGLDGTGQIINIVDSGVDLFSSFFYDPQNSLESVTNKTNLKHRKVVRIEAYADNTDYEDGHGTHVCGTAVGSSHCTKCGISQYNGIAYGAKLYLSDFIDSETSEDIGDFDLDEQMRIFKQLDVHVSSNSWGYPEIYRDISFMYNKIAYENPDVLYVFAAGNDRKFNSIHSPGNSKNVLTVGATQQISAAILENSFATVYIVNESAKIFSSEYMAKRVHENSVSENMRYFVNLSLVAYKDPDFSDPSFNASDYYCDKIVLLNNQTGNDEDICERVHRVTDFGAAAAIYIPNGNYLICKELPKIPLLRITKEAAVNDIPILLEMKSISLLPEPGEEKSLPSIRSSSSRGPTDSGLSKPDIVAPGTSVFSAKSHGSSTVGVTVNASFDVSISEKSGTSMATPAVSALAVIILQYFRDGFYPRNVNNSGDSITPSSCLIRALLVNAADRPIEYNTNSKSGPSIEVGFGIPCLERALGFNGNGFRFVDNQVMPSNSHHSYVINLDSKSSDLNVTLVYLDPPLSPENQALLFADLDLYVKSPSGKIYYGNDASFGDTMSITERVIIDKGQIESGAYEIHVLSSSYPIVSQKVTYSVVVNGPFDQENIERNPAILQVNDKLSDQDCPNDCNGNGKCVKGKCTCNDAFLGPYCNIPITNIEERSSYIYSYEYKNVRYFRLPLTDTQNIINISLEFTESIGKAPLYLSFTFNEAPGKYTNAGWESNSICFSLNENPSHEQYTIYPPSGQNPSSLYIAIFTGYHQAVNVNLSNVVIARKPKPPTSIPSEVLSSTTEDSTSIITESSSSTTESSSSTTESSSSTTESSSSTTESSSSTTESSSSTTESSSSTTESSSSTTESSSSTTESSSSTTESSSSIAESNSLIDFSSADGTGAIDADNEISSGHKSNHMTVVLIVMSVVLILVVVSIIIAIYVIKKNKKNKYEKSINLNLLLNSSSGF